VLIGRAITGGGRTGDRVRRFVIPQLPRIPGLRARATDSATPPLHRSRFVQRRPTSRSRLPGTLCPNAEITPGRRLDTVTGLRFALVVTNPLTAAERAAAQALDVWVHQPPPGGELSTWLRRGHARAALVRPDGTVMAAGHSAGALLRTLANQQASGGLPAPARWRASHHPN